jgi:Flp pilus assembly protein TadB
VFPFFLFAVIWLISPGYYGDVLDQPIVIPALVFMLLWMTFGDFIMYRMVHFDF